jgi:ribonucleoside-diphosphate reductase alpha chain
LAGGQFTIKCTGEEIMTREAQDLVSKFLEDKQLTKELATPQQMSDALAFESCYNWYRTKMNVLPENAELAAKVWLQKYALHDKSGMCLEKTPEDMWDRIANALTEEELLTNPLTLNREEVFAEFRNILDGFKYTPQGSGLFALGNMYVKSSASNCFVLPSPEDSLDSIFETAKLMAKIYAFRGGIGIDISNLRPYGAATNNAARSSTGAASFMDFYSYVTGMIGQQGRRGALMLTMRVDHPDIFRFIEMKRDLDKQPFFNELEAAGININDYKHSAIADRLKSASHSNVSVRLTKAFMEAVKNDTNFELYFDFDPASGTPRYSEFVRARDIWDKLMHSAWESAEPGILNWDHILEESPADQYLNLTDIEFTDPLTGETKTVSYSFRTVSTNPCGEVPLSGGDSCCLGTFFLPAFVKNPWTDKAYFDFDMYIKHIQIGVKAQDNIKNWDSRILPLEINRISAILGRRISLGNHGLADCLASLGLKYDSEEARVQTDKIYECLKNTAYEQSADLAAVKGKFQVFDYEKHSKSPFFQRLKDSVKKKIKKNGLRNIALLTNAPTGSMSVLSRNCSSGIEPIFLKSYNRNVKIPGTNDFETFVVYHQALQDCIEAGGNPDVFIEAGNIDPEKRVELQATIQKHIDHAISVTTNLKSDATVETVELLYKTAFEKGCKGFTVYRDGSRTGVLNAIKAPEKTHKTLERPKTTNIDIHKVKYRDKQWAVLVGRVDNGPIEVFAGIEEDTPLPNKYHRAELTKKSRGHYSLTVYLSEDEDDVIKINNIGARFPLPEGMTLTRFISLALKNGVPVSAICEQLTKSSSSMFDYPAVLNRVLKSYITVEEYSSTAGDKPCPECGKSLKFRKQDGCMVEFCESCSYLNSKCG